MRKHLLEQKEVLIPIKMTKWWRELLVGPEAPLQVPVAAGGAEPPRMVPVAACGAEARQGAVELESIVTSDGDPCFDRDSVHHPAFKFHVLAAQTRPIS